jgi:hypothetical protein
MRGLLPALLLLAALAAPARAQSPDSAPPVIPSGVTVPVWRRPWVRPLASLLVPGAGQVLGGQDRGVVYLAAEVLFLGRALALARQGRRERAYFQTLAFDVARSAFTTVRRDGPWEYYEAMGRYVESGAYNLLGPTGFAPETDTLTYNGAMWLLARRNYFENPDSIPATTSSIYRAALAFYKSRAVTDEYRWSWRDARLEMGVYRQAIQNSDEGYREATNYFGAILANHLVSVVDAFISTRLGKSGVMPHVLPQPGSSSFFLVWTRTF